MRGNDQQQNHVFSYVSPEQRVPQNYLLRPIRRMVDAALKELSPQFDTVYAKVGRPSIPREQLLRVQLLQMFYSGRAIALLMEEMDYSIVSLVCGAKHGRPGVGCHGVHQEPRPAAGRRPGQGVSVAGGGTSSGEGLGLGRTLQRGRHAAGSVGQRQEFSAEGQAAGATAGRSRHPTVDFHGEKPSNETHC
jgi:hypothetical protein